MAFLSRPAIYQVALRSISTSSALSIGFPPKIPPASELVARAPKPMQKYLRLMRADKPTGTMLLYWPSAWSLALAASPTTSAPIGLLTLFGAGAFAMRSAGCVINDLWDKDYDRQVERTRTRPLASGELTTTEAVLLLSGLLSGSLAILAQLNTASILVGASSMALVVGYPLAKRYTDWPQVMLGATLNWGVLIAWAHLLPPSEWWKVAPLYLATCLHTFIYDTIYAHQDKKDDASIGVRSTALHLGERTKPVLTKCASALTASLALSGLLMDQTWPYYLGVAATSAHVFWQVLSVKIDDPDDCWNKFKSNTWMGSMLLIAIIWGNLEKKKKNSDKKDIIVDDLQ